MTTFLQSLAWKVLHPVASLHPVTEATEVCRHTSAATLQANSMWCAFVHVDLLFCGLLLTNMQILFWGQKNFSQHPRPFFSDVHTTKLIMTLHRSNSFLFFKPHQVFLASV
jgi:hypothetical protein